AADRQQPALVAPGEYLVADRAEMLAGNRADQLLFAPGASLVAAQRVEQGPFVVAVLRLVVGDVIPGDEQPAVRQGVRRAGVDLEGLRLGDDGGSFRGGWDHLRLLPGPAAVGRAGAHQDLRSLVDDDERAVLRPAKGRMNVSCPWGVRDLDRRVLGILRG